MAERLEVSKLFIEEGYKTYQAIKYSGVSSSTWYNHLNKKGDDKRKKNRGRPFPGYSFNQRGEKVYDEIIISALKTYRSKIEFINAGGYHKLSHYLYREWLHSEPQEGIPFMRR